MDFKTVVFYTIFEIFRVFLRFLIGKTYLLIDFGFLTDFGLEILEHQSFLLTSGPGNTGKPVGNDTVAVCWYICFGKVTFWDFLDMFRLNK